MATIFGISPRLSFPLPLPRPIFAFTPKFLSAIPFTNPRLQLLHSHHNNKVLIHRLPSSSFRNGSNTPSETECPVPQDQLPINEYQSLSTSSPFSWASGDIVEYSSRLFVTGASFALLIGLPVSWFGSVGAESEPLKRILCATSSGVFAVTLAVVRMYLGWAYVGNRLLSATVEYEETGWYDGQESNLIVTFPQFSALSNIFSESKIHTFCKSCITGGLLFNFNNGTHSLGQSAIAMYASQIWVKTAEVLARDRLLGSFSVKPVLSRLKLTLVSLATSLFVFALILINMDGDQNGPYITSKEAGVRVIPGVYNDDSARSFEPDAFCGDPDLL